MFKARRFGTWLFATVLGGFVVAAIMLAFILGGRLRSPEQVAADAAPPPPSQVTVAAQQRVLVEPVVLRGQVKAGASVQLLAPAGATGETSVITKVQVKTGVSLTEGMIPFERSGEPMVALRLRFPLWRDLSGGAKGPDVTEVQLALGRLGYRVPSSGEWDPATQQAIGRLFTARGYDALTGDAKAAERLDQARSAVGEAEREWAAAVEANTRVADAKLRLDSARKALQQAELAAGPALPVRAVLRLDQVERKITGVRVRVGSVLTEARAPLLELDGEAPYISTTITADQAGLVSVGQEGVVVDEVAGETATVKVSSVADEVAPGAAGLEVRLAFQGKPMSAGQDRSVRVDLTSGKDSAELLAVPVTAVYARTDGTMFVSVVGPSGTAVDVTVLVDRIAGGWVGVTPESDVLRPGALVVVGEHAAELSSSR
ncbi:hypothetical protein AB0J90_28635 [Micromonospora sp. NPDC049523]|uniref:hypothetical protein n=1 Tax=Micromonospora sp. NPDC049523 TaxID=3155921 RepID=UPI00342C34AB